MCPETYHCTHVVAIYIFVKFGFHMQIQSEAMLIPVCFSASAKLHMRVACSLNVAAFLVSVSWTVCSSKYQKLENARKNAEYVINGKEAAALPLRRLWHSLYAYVCIYVLIYQRVWWRQYIVSAAKSSHLKANASGVLVYWMALHL